MKKDNELDQLFKKGLENPEIPFNELDWNKMADKLDTGAPKKLRPFWLYTAAGIAAALLVVLFWFLADNTPATQNKTNANVKAKAKPSATDDNKSKSAAIEGPLEQPEQTDEKAVRRAIRSASAPYVARNPSLTKREETITGETPLLADVKMPQLRSNDLSVLNSSGIRLSIPNIAKGVSTTENEEEDPESVIKKMQNASPRKLVLTILAAPDITNTSSSVANKVSRNFGLLLTYPLSKKLSVSSGAVYAKKLYDYGGVGPSVYGNAGPAWEVDAACFVIDVPLNLNYQVLKKRNIAISVNSGLSSYFMLKEKYEYIYAEPDGSTDVSALEIKNQNQHILGVANFSLSFEHRVSRNVSIGLQPFYKVPLTGIGLYDINLKSKGVAVSLSISPFGKRK